MNLAHKFSLASIARAMVLLFLPGIFSQVDMEIKI